MPTHHLLRGLRYEDLKTHDSPGEALRRHGVSVIESGADDAQVAADMARTEGVRLVLRDGAPETIPHGVVLSGVETLTFAGQPPPNAEEVMRAWRRQQPVGSVFVVVASPGEQVWDDDELAMLFEQATAAWKASARSNS